MKRFLTVAAAMLALTGMGQVAMRKLEDLTNTNLVCVTDYGPQLVSVTGGLASISGALAVHTNRTDNPHGVTAVQIGALTAEADPVAGPRLDLIEPETNKWNAAYGWGDHALAGYLLPADLAPYATTQQIAAAAAALAVHTNRTDNPHGVTAAQVGALTAEQDLAALRTYHYGSPDIVESPAEWFVFDGAGTITAFNWEAGRTNVVIPWAIGGVPVTEIGLDAFKSSAIVSVIAPQTVTMIGDSAFRSCGSLASVSLPQVQTIEEDAFAFCGSLASVSLPQATTMGDYAFYDCASLASVSLPQAQTIGGFAFGYCGSLASVSLPQAQTIGGFAFADCTLLTAVHMGQNAPAGAADVFTGIATPPTVYVTDPQATGWGDTWNGAPVVRPPLYAEAIYQAGELVATTGHVAQAIAAIPELDPVANAALAVHTNRIDNPHGVTAAQIGALTAEQDLAALRTYHYGSPDIVESPAEWFTFDAATGTITAFNWSAGRENVVIPWAIGGVPVTAIGANAFQSSGITSVIAPQATSIGDRAFYNCYSLTSVNLPQATSIGGHAFDSCGRLTSVIIPQATSIGDYAFAYCYTLTSVIIPQATSIGDYAFAYCYTLTSASLPQATSIGNSAFYGCEGLTSASLPQATSIGNSAFYGCAMLTAVRMGQNTPPEAAEVFYGIDPPPNVYVTNPQATGWGDTWNGAPVVRPPLHADAIYQAGEPVATTGHVAQAIASQLPGIVYSNSVSALTIYTNASGAATSWWSVARGVTNSGTFASDGGSVSGAITNGQSGPLTLGSMTILANGNVGVEGNSTPSKPLEFAATTGEKIMLYKNGGYSLGVESNEMRYNITGILGRYTFNRGSAYATPTELFRVGPALGIHTPGYVGIGPTISGKQAHIFTDGTNCFFVNVNSVTNTAGGSVPYTDWTGTVTPQNGTATVAYAHGNMPVLVVPDGGGTTYVTVATGTYAATSGVSRVSLSIWAGTNTIELVTNEVNYATAPDIPTNGWGTILFRRVSNGKWKGVGL